MLIVARKEGQDLHIGDEIRIEVKSIDGKWVKLAIDAPRSIPIAWDRETKGEEGTEREGGGGSEGGA